MTDCSVSPCDGGGTCTACTGTGVGWGYEGGFVAYVDSSSVAPCRAYTHRREGQRPPAMPLRCDAELSDCAQAGRLAQLLVDPVITQALGAHTLYGVDPRPVDGAVFHVATDAGFFDVGSCSPECRPAPVKELQELLQAIDEKQLMIEPCRSTF